MSTRNRLEILIAAISRQSGEWTTERVRRLYTAANYPAPMRHTARRDLTALLRAGLLELHDEIGRRYYVRTGA